MSSSAQQGMLARGLSLLTALGDFPEGVTVTDLSRTVGLPVSTTHRLLAIEIEMGFVVFDANSKAYRLGTRVFELATRVSLVNSVADIARPIMRELSLTTGETVQLSVLSDGRALFIEKVGTEQAVGIRGSIGQGEPVHATSTGKVLLSQLSRSDRKALLDRLTLTAWTPNTITDRAVLEAELERVVEQDYAIADEEFDAGVRAIGVPVRDSRGVTRAALCVSAPAFRTTLETLREWLLPLQHAAHEIGVHLTATMDM